MEISEYRQVQTIAKETMRYARRTLCPGMALTELRRLLEDRMRQLGADSFWYWDVGAFVFAGEETVLSVSGREYRTSDRVLRRDDIITVDLSPQRGSTWGDHAATFILQDGEVAEPDAVRNEEWRAGLRMEELLHRRLQEIARPDMSFEELHGSMNLFIQEQGFVNLDFLGNLGHSIVRRKEERIYIEKGNRTPLGEAGLFTFEPHISRPDSRYGFKNEQIYCFENGRPKAL